jgi:hypothetical protein
MNVTGQASRSIGLIGLIGRMNFEGRLHTPMSPMTPMPDAPAEDDVSLVRRQI